MGHDIIAITYLALALCEVGVAIIYRAKDAALLSVVALAIAACYLVISFSYVFAIPGK
jgi:hypothetical protein